MQRKMTAFPDHSFFAKDVAQTGYTIGLVNFRLDDEQP